MESNFSVILKLAAIATTSFVLSVYSFAQDRKDDKEVSILRVSAELKVSSSDIQYHTDSNPFVAFQFLKTEKEGVLPDRPYCHLWIKKDVLAKLKAKTTAPFNLGLNPKSVLIIKEQPMINANIVDQSIQYKVDHTWVSELYCKNISKIDDVKSVIGIGLSESKAIMLAKKLPPRKPAKSVKSARKK